MKMTIEQKAKAYDEAIGREIDFMDDKVHYVLKPGESIVNWIFPELRESEDERIRKEIIYHIQNCDDTIDEETEKRMIAWLEKQGAQKSIDAQFTPEQSSVLDKHIDKFLEQEPAYKEKLKFHEGDWIVISTSDSRKIVQVVSIEYFQSGQPRYITSEGKWFGNGTKAHLWNIQDTKDGDVLADNYGIYIFNCFDSSDDKLFICKCAYSYSRKMFEVGGMLCSKTDVYPATKEQRELLLQKMKENGYEFDFSKKELKKIELTKSESEEELSDFEAALFSAFSDGWQQYLNGEEIDFAEWAKEHSAELLEAANQKPAEWSKEDEDMIRYIGNAITCKESAKYLEEKGVDMIKAHCWLDSCKPQPKQEWSEKDESMYTRTLGILGKCYIGQLPTKVEEELKWLKSLRPQNHWKPTKEQMHYLSWVANIKLGDSVVEQVVSKHLNELYEDLKKFIEE